MVGDPAFANIQPDGSFVLTTYEEGDGAVVGQHHPVVFGNRKEEDPNAPQPPPGPDIGVIRMQDTMFEVVAGQENVFTVEIKSRSPDVLDAVRDD